jgi:hypothetical protein
MSGVIQTAVGAYTTNTATGTATFVTQPKAGNAVIAVIITGDVFTPAAITSVVDNQSGNVFTKRVSAIDSSSGNYCETETWWCSSIKAPTGTYTVTATYANATQNLQVALLEVNGITAADKTGTGNTEGTSTTATASGANVAANSLVVAAIGLGNYVPGSGLTNPPAGYTTLGFYDLGVAKESCYKITSAVETSSATWTRTNSSFSAATIATFSLAPPLGDGYTASGTTVSTGTGGAAMPAVAVGQLIDVLFMAQSSTTQTVSVSDNLGNTYNLVDSGGAWTGYSKQFAQFYCMTTVAGSPIITATYGAAAPLSIAAAVLPSGSVSTTLPFSAGSYSTNTQSVNGAVDNSTSLAVPTLAFQPATLTGWSYSDAKTSAPLAGTGFTQIGTLWSALGGACLTYETKALSSTTGVPATFTTTATLGSRAFNFAVVYNGPSATSYTLAAGAGSYAITGQAANLASQNYTLIAASGSYAISGQVAGMAPSTGTAFVLIASPGTYDIVGATSLSDFQVDADVGTYAIAGFPSAAAIPVSVAALSPTGFFDIYDNMDGSLKLAWGAFTPLADSYNVYVDGVLNQNVDGQPIPLFIDLEKSSGELQLADGTFYQMENGTSTPGIMCTVKGLQIATYDVETQVITPAHTYDIKIVGVLNGVESGVSLDLPVTPGPTSVQLTTQMKRLYPFPNSGIE